MLSVANGITKHLSCSGSRDWVKIYMNFLASSASHSQVSSVYVTGILNHSKTGWLFWFSPSSSRESKSKFVQDSINECWGQVGIACNWGAATTGSYQVWPHKNVDRELPDLLIFQKKKKKIQKLWWLFQFLNVRAIKKKKWPKSVYLQGQSEPMSCPSEATLQQSHKTI